MARKEKIGPGHEDYWARTPAERVAHAEAMTRRAETEPAERAQFLVMAAEEFQLADEPERAEPAFLAAIADGGRVAGGSRSAYAAFLFRAGRTDEAYAMLEAARKAGPEDWIEYLATAELLTSQDDFTAALRWLTRGLVSQFGSLAEIDLDLLIIDEPGYSLARMRQVVRLRAGLEPDVLDGLTEEAAAEKAELEKAELD